MRPRSTARVSVGRLAARVVLAACAPLAACGIEFTEPERQAGPRDAAFHFAVLEEPDRFGLIAALDPGLDTEGQVRPVPNDSIRFAGVVLAPTAVQPDGTRSYRAEWNGTDPAAPRDGDTVEAPAVGGLAERPVLRWAAVHVPGPDTVTVVRGDELRLPVERRPGGPAPRMGWSLHLRAGENSIMLQNDGAPPDTIRLSTGWLPDGFTGLADLILTIDQRVEDRPPPGTYRAGLTARSLVRREVLIIDPSAAGTAAAAAPSTTGNEP